MSTINCPKCGKDVEVFVWANHKMNHPEPVQSSMFKPTKKLMNAANKLSDTMAKAGGGSISIDGKEIVRIPPAR